MSVKPTRILLLMHELSLTGAPIAVLRLFEALAKMQPLDVRVISLADGPLAQRVARLGAMRVFPASQLPRGSWVDAVRRKLRLVRWNLALRLFLRGWAPEVTYVNTVGALPLAQWLKLPDAPVVLHVHEYDTAIKLWLRHDWQRRLLLECPVHYVAVSDAVRQMLVERFHVAADRVTVIRNIEPSDAPDHGAMPAQGSRNGAPFVVGGAGAPVWQKGTVLWLQMAAELQRLLGPERVRFVWVGTNDGFWATQFRATAEKLGVSAALECVDITATPLREFARFDAFALTSWEDACPLVVLENMVLGKPVACFAGSGGAPEQVGDAGLIIEHFSPIEMARRLAELARDPKRLAELGARARARVSEQFAPAKIVPGFREMLHRLARPQ